MKPTSTPGPWKFLKADGRIVYSVGHNDHEILWSDADYQLVAAAPELLASLECALNQLDALERAYEVNSDGHLSGSGLPPPSRTEAYRNARAVLTSLTTGDQKP